MVRNVGIEESPFSHSIELDEFAFEDCHSIVFKSENDE